MENQSPHRPSLVPQLMEVWFRPYLAPGAYNLCNPTSRTIFSLFSLIYFHLLTIFDRYFLTPKSTKPVTRSGGAFGSTQKPQKTTPSALADSRKKKAEEKKKAAAAEARKQQAEERRKAALAAAEKKKASAVAAAEARKQQAEERRQAALTAAEARKQQAEEKRQASLVAIEARRKEAEEKRAAASAATQKQAQAKKAQKVVSGAKSRSTISLGFLNFGKSDDDDSSQSSPAGTGKKAPKIVSTAPRGVPTLFRWRQNRDGSITGAISGENSFPTHIDVVLHIFISNA
jgi:hypothetical protein